MPFNADMMTGHFRQLAAYNRWANARLYAAALALPEEAYRRPTGVFFGSLHGTLNHLLLTDRVWLKRLTGQGEHPTQLNATLYEDRAGSDPGAAGRRCAADLSRRAIRRCAACRQGRLSNHVRLAAGADPCRHPVAFVQPPDASSRARPRVPFNRHRQRAAFAGPSAVSTRRPRAGSRIAGLRTRPTDTSPPRRLALGPPTHRFSNSN